MKETVILRYIFSRLAGGQNIALISPKDSEKTELLHQIGNPKIFSQWLPNPKQWIFNYTAANQFTQLETSADFWQRVWQSFAKEAKYKTWVFLIEELVNNGGSKTDRVLRQVDQQQGRLVLLLDDLDELAKNPRLFTPDLLGPLRSLSSRHQSFSVIFTSQRRLSELNHLVAMSGSPPFNNFNEVLLSEFMSA